MTQRTSFVALGSALFLAALGALWAAHRPRTLLARLVASAPRDARTIEARPSGGFSWAPFRRQPRLAAAASVVRGWSDEDPSSDRHALAIAHLLRGASEPAIRELRVLAASSADAAVWNDLGAASYEAATRTGSIERLRDALAATDQALLLNARYTESLFNRALILERLRFREVAAEAWRRFLAAEDAEPWRREALQHLHALTAPQRTFATEVESAYARVQMGDSTAAQALVRIDAGEARAFGETDALARWGEAWLRADVPAAERHATAVRTLARELKRVAGESLLADSASAITNAGDRARDTLARGHLAMRDGRTAWKARRLAEAEALFGRAARDLEAGRSPLARQARFLELQSAFWQGRRDEAEAAWLAMLSEVPEEHAALRVQLEWLVGSAHVTRSETGTALRLLTRAADGFTRLGEKKNAAHLHNVISQVYDGAGDFRRGWEHRTLALGEIGRTSDFLLAHLLNGMVYESLQRKDWRAARAFLNVQIAVNEHAGDAEVQTAALLRRARVTARVHDDAAAAADLRAARAVIAAVQDQAHREKLQNDCDAATALVSRDPRTALPLLTRVLEYHASRGWLRVMPDLYLQRGRMHRMLGDQTQAAADFEAGITALERHRKTIASGEQRWGALDAGEELFDEAMAEALRSGAAPAFAYSERKRARALADALGVRQFDPSRLPAGTLIVEYASLPDRLLVFTADASRLDVTEVAASRERLAALSGEFRDALRDESSAERDRLAGDLSKLLVAPVWSAIAAHREVVFVTDAATADVPFAALCGTPGRPLIEDITISVSPSATLFLQARLRPSAPRTRVLLVDSPINDALGRLAAAPVEAQAVEAAHARVSRLTGAAATRDAFVAASRDADVIHFAGHGVAGLDSSALLLTATKSDSGIFDASAISRLDLRNTDVVVLAACETNRGPVRPTEGTLSVTHAFLQAGAHAVIATLWPINDRWAAEFFPRVHRHLANGAPAAEALRLAQLESIRRSPRDGKFLWAAVQAVGY